LVWTARHYILEEALAESRLGENVDEFPGSHEVLVEVGDLTVQEKAEILYNHAKLAGLSCNARKLVRRYYLPIISHPNYFLAQKCQPKFRVLSGGRGRRL
jgi:hypothetical protein